MRRKAAATLVGVMFAAASVSAAGASSDHWTRRTPLQVARNGVAAAVVDHKIFVIGGQSYDSESHEGVSLGTVEESDDTRGPWTFGPPMPTPRDQLGVTSTPSGLIYAIGGESSFSHTVLDTVEVFDPSTGEWSEGPSLPSPRSEPSVFASGNRILAIGGYGSGCAQTNTTFELKVVLHKWVLRAPMPTARRGAASAQLPDGRIVIAGGSTQCGGESTITDAVEIYSPASNTWQTVAPLPVPIEFGAAATGADGRVYVTGGYNPAFGNPHGYLAEVQVYDPALDTWVTGPALRTARASLATVAVGKQIYAIGGERHHGIDGFLANAVEMLKVAPEPTTATH
jgi:N-acetylneuraminic acid mutarotase